MMPRARLEGLDVARFFAFVGMVIVNFTMVMAGAYPENNGLDVSELLQGRAAASFVVLAGIGLGLAANNKAWGLTVTTTLKRALFLLVLGLLNAVIFDADIIHYYAVYFVFALMFLRAPNWAIWTAIIGLVLSSTVMIITLDFDAGWDWDTLTYTGFWTLEGFLRNLLFNGWHPVFPWAAFMLFGIWISRLDLRSAAIKRRLVIYGLGVLLCTTVLSSALMDLASEVDKYAALLFSTSPVPAFPLYMLAGASFASALLGLCLCLEGSLRRAKLLSVFTLPGRQTLTLYIAHILLGMGTLEALGLIEGQTTRLALCVSAGFCGLSIVYCLIWSKRFSRGPLEMLMRRLT